MIGVAVPMSLLGYEKYMLFNPVGITGLMLLIQLKSGIAFNSWWKAAFHRSHDNEKYTQMIHRQTIMFIIGCILATYVAFGQSNFGLTSR